MEDFPGSDGTAGAAPETSLAFPSLHSSSTSTDELQNLKKLKRRSLPHRPHGSARHAKRLTLNFPINLPPGTVSDPSSSSPGVMTPTQSSARQSPALPVGTPVPFDGHDENYDFLTAIASQERKVLELREELQRAETELATLKKQWALSEKARKTTEISCRAEPMLPLKSPEQQNTGEEAARSTRTTDSVSAVQARLSRELERRSSVRAAAAAGDTISANGRRVFQGSHTRTLSLLSPISGPTPGSESEDSKSGIDRIARTPRSATLPSVERRNPSAFRTSQDGTNANEDLMSQWRKSMPPPSREMLMRTGKQMASDLREGLWTFLEDIRQATVGEEGINATESRSIPSTLSSSSSSRRRDPSATSRSRDRLSVQRGDSTRSSSSSRGRVTGTISSGNKDAKSTDIAASFWSEFGVDTPGQKSPRNRPKVPNTRNGQTEPDRSNLLDTDDNWDMWDTPQPKKTHTPSSSRSTVESKQDQSPMTQMSSPRTSASFGDWNPVPNDSVPDPSVSDGIPWPALTNLAPSKLQRTASNLMAEWERSLSSSPERKGSPQLGKDSKKD